MPGSNGFLDLARPSRRQAARARPHARDRQGPQPARHRGHVRHRRASSSTSSSSAGARATSRTTSRRRSRSTARSRRRSSAAARSSRPSTRATSSTSSRSWLERAPVLARRDLRRHDRDPARAKLELIAEFARDFTVLSEVGSKDADVEHRAVPVGAVDARGARGRRLEGDHRGRARAAPPASSGRPASMRTGLVDEIAHAIDVRRPHLRGADEGVAGVVREALRPDVNLGNIPPDEVIPLETLRLGLRGDTLKEVLLGERAGSFLSSTSRRCRAEEILRWAYDAVRRPHVPHVLLAAAVVACSCTWSPSSGSTSRVVELDTQLFFRGDVRDARPARRALRPPRSTARGVARRRAGAAQDGRTCGSANPDRCCHIRKVEPLERALATSTRWITGIRRDQSPTRADAPKVGWDEQHELWKAKPLADWDDERVLGLHPRPRAARTTRCTTPGYPSIGCTPLHAPGPGGERRALGGQRQARVRHPHGGARMSGFVLWFTGLSAAGKTTIARLVGAGARGARRCSSTSSTATSCASISRRASASRRRTATRTSSASAGSPRGSPAPAPRSSSRRSRRTRRHARSARALVEEHAPFVEVHVATSLEECARRDPKGLYAKALRRRDRASSPASPTRTRSRRTRSCGSRPRAARRTSRRRPCSPARGARAHPGRSRHERRRVAADALAPRRARGRGDPHHARGRRRARAARAALLRRQGLDRAAAPRGEGVPAGQVPVPGDARRHGPQLPRGGRVPRPARRGARRAAGRRLASRSRSTTGRVVDQTGPRASRNQLQTTTLLDAIEEHGFDAAIGGARRDEERARAKERIFSFRDDFGQWNPRAQRPELWSLYNARIRKGEHIRVFPISNWTELDVWQYVARERLELPSIYFAHEREVFRRDGMLYAASDCVERYPDEEPFRRRFASARSAT